MSGTRISSVKAKILFKLASQSLWYRRGAVLLTITAIAVSVFTLLNVEHLRHTTKQSFNSTVSGVDLIVGPRTGELNLLLTTVFRIGHPSQNMSWQSYQHLINHPKIAWAIPISLGDSHQGFRVVGTHATFFNHYHYGKSRALAFSSGNVFSDTFDVVLGASVAHQLGYTQGQSLVLAHGIGHTSFHHHDTHPFNVSGILAPTGTPVDNALYVSLSGLEAIHHPPETYPGELSNAKLTPQSISAVMVGLTSKLATFTVQRELNNATSEPLTAILPGVALTELWQMSRGIESALTLMAQLILIGSLLGLGAVMIATLRERTYELAVLRTLGARPRFVFILLQFECLLVALLGIVIGVGGFVLGILIAAGPVAEQYGIDIGVEQISAAHGYITLYILGGTVFAGSIPAWIGFNRARNI